MNIQEGDTGRSPMLLVSVVGPHYFQVFGAVWNGAKVCVDPLSDPVSLLFVRRDPRHGVSKVARVLAAIASTIDGLKQYYSNPTSEGRKGPYFMQDKLEYGEKIGERDWLLEAKLEQCDGQKEVCVKFICSCYGIKVHELLDEHQLAPKLFSYTHLPGRWVAVVMEKVNRSYLYSMTEPLRKTLNKPVDLMHAQNYMHGDLRLHNILVVQHSVYIVDFDWAGECATARYPPELSKGEVLRV